MPNEHRDHGVRGVRGVRGVAAALLVGLVGACGDDGSMPSTADATRSDGAGSAGGERADFADIPDLVDDVQPSVVAVVTDVGEGSGVIYDDDGAARRLELPEQRHVAALHQQIVMRHAGDMRIRSLAQQPATLEIRCVAGGHHHRPGRVDGGHRRSRARVGEARSHSAACLCVTFSRSTRAKLSIITIAAIHIDRFSNSPINGLST